MVAHFERSDLHAPELELAGPLTLTVTLTLTLTLTVTVTVTVSLTLTLTLTLTYLKAAPFIYYGTYVAFFGKMVLVLAERGLPGANV